MTKPNARWFDPALREPLRQCRATRKALRKEWLQATPERLRALESAVADADAALMAVKRRLRALSSPEDS
jgi:hypothetical protein